MHRGKGFGAHMEAGREDERAKYIVLDLRGGVRQGHCA